VYGTGRREVGIGETRPTRYLALATHVDVISYDKPIEANLKRLVRSAETREFNFTVERLVCKTGFANH
jgi:hypothetical protein